MTAAVLYAEAFLLPIVARENPELVGWDGPVITSTAVLTTTGIGVLWLVGLTMVGPALWRARVVTRGPALTLAFGAVSFATLTGIPIAGAVATVVFSAAHVWVGSQLLSAGARTQPASLRA